MINDIKELWHYKAYRNLLFSRAISRFGDSIDVVAFSWLVYQITGSAVLLGLIYTINILPNILLSPFVGPLTNYLPGKLIIVLGDLLRASIVLVVIVLYKLEMLEPYHLYITTALASTIEVFVIASKSSIYQLSLPSESYMKANAIGNILIQSAQLIGFAIAGGVVALFGVESAMGIDLLTFLISGVIILLTKLPVREVTVFSHKNYVENLKLGYRFIFKDKTLMAILGLCATLGFLITPINAFLPIYVDETLRQGAGAIGILSIVITVGTLIGGVVVNHLGNKISPYKCVILPLILVGIMYSALALPMVLSSISGTVVASIIFLLIGMCLPFLNILFNTYIMKKTPNRLIAHVASVAGMVVMVANPLGASFFGIIANHLSIGVLYLINGIVMVVAVLIFSQTKGLKALSSFENINMIPSLKDKISA